MQAQQLAFAAKLEVQLGQLEPVVVGFEGGQPGAGRLIARIRHEDAVGLDLPAANPAP